MPRTTVQVNVVPIFSGGGETVCELHPRRSDDRSYVDGGVVRLPPRGAPYEIEFHIEPASSQTAFDRRDPWWCKRGTCPERGDNDPQFGHPRVDPSGKILTVDSPPAAGPVALHYSLNFDDGSRFDPIIVKT